MSVKLYQDADWLRYQYIENYLTQKEIGELCGVNAHVICNWMKKFCIQARQAAPYAIAHRTEPNENAIHELEILQAEAIKNLNQVALYKNREWLKQKYIDERLTLGEIGELCGVTHGAIRWWMVKFDIKTRERKTMHSDESRLRKSRQMILDRKTDIYAGFGEKIHQAWERGRYEEMKKKLSEIQKEHWRSGDTLLGGDEWKKKVSKNVKRLWREGVYDHIHKNRSEETRRRLSESIIKYYEDRPELRKQISMRVAKYWEDPDYRERQSIAQSKYCGELSPVWKGGISFGAYPFSFNAKFKETIRERDSYTCAICRLRGNIVHHIDYIKKNTYQENCITLCRTCHSCTNFHREYWETELSKIMCASGFV